MTSRRDCSGKVWGAYRDVSGRVYKCRRPATVEREGKWYCWQHDPEYVKANKERRMAAWEAEADRKSAIWKRRTRDARLAELVTPKLTRTLIDLAHIADIWGYSETAKRGHSLAARVREALEKAL